jgi:hypothetical protein
MKYYIDVHPDGKQVVTVTDRGQRECGEIKQLTNMLGREISDEQIGPERDRQEETIQ